MKIPIELYGKIKKYFNVRFDNPIFNEVLQTDIEVFKSQGGMTKKINFTHFLSQIAHETDDFRTLKEYGNNKYFERYKDRKDIKIWVNNEPLYIGRGYIMITGYDNYRLLRHAYNPNSPTDLENPKLALELSLKWWNTRNLNITSSVPDTKAVTKRVNGGLNGWYERNKYFHWLDVALEKLEW